MAIDRRYWQPQFPKFPSWQCPTCQNGSLAVDPDTMRIVETGPSEKSHSHEAWEPDWIVERFAGLLTCQNAECGELVAIGGQTVCDWFYGEEQEQQFYREFRPIFMHPAPLIFPIPDKCPDSVATQLRKASSLFWSDTGACANRLRAAAEALLTDKKVPRITVTSNGRRERLSFHARIEKLKQADPHSADYLLAIKWIGNVGSHSNFDELGWTDLLDGFELFEHLVEQLYMRREKRMQKIARRINSRKGRPARHKSPFTYHSG